MFRYIAFCWNRDNPTEVSCANRLAARLESSSSDWRLSFSGSGVRVYSSDERDGASGSLRLQNDQGVVLGTLFERVEATAQQPRPLRSLGANESARMMQTAGRALIDAYWGRYVAFIQNRHTNRLWIIRDPTGALPCLRMVIDGVRVFAAHIEDCCGLTRSTFDINWNFVRARVLVRYLQTTATGLNGVSQLLPGSCVELCAGESKESCYWHPWQIAESTIVEDATQAVGLLRDTVTSCVHAWASCHRSILLKLSGGLDSAIVLGSLSTAKEPPKVVCVTDHSPGGDTDERHYARLAASRANCTLVERIRDPAPDLARILTFRRTSSPIPSHVWIQTRPTNEEVATLHSATALFTGNGGDYVFLAGRSEWPLVDYLYRHGAHLRAIRMARDASLHEPPARCRSIWTLARKGVRLGLLGDRRREPLSAHPDYSAQTVIDPDVIAAFASEHRSWSHPWFHGLSELPPGKISQAQKLSFPNSFYPMSTQQSDNLEPVHPLVSQPIVELCLRTPTYALVTGTIDRTTARRAFEHLICHEIAWRRSKGGVNDYAVDILLRNVRFLQEFLLDGELMHHKILNRRVLEDALGGKQEGLSVGTAEITNLLQVEAWLRAWTAPRAATNDFQAPDTGAANLAAAQR